MTEEKVKELVCSTAKDIVKYMMRKGALIELPYDLVKQILSHPGLYIRIYESKFEPTQGGGNIRTCEFIPLSQAIKEEANNGTE